MIGPDLVRSVCPDWLGTVRPFFRGSGVIFASATPPGSHRPRVAPGRIRRYSSPSTPCPYHPRRSRPRRVSPTPAPGGRSGRSLHVCACRSVPIGKNDQVSPLRFPVRVRPGASRNAVGGGYDGPNGRALVVAVTAPAVAGRATEAVLRTVARALGVRRGAVSLIAGANSRNKTLAVDPASPEVAARLQELLGPDPSV
ncbi:MAG TPA: DUF167 domain-containing protein [Mycobacteriales bacterium]